MYRVFCQQQLNSHSECPDSEATQIEEYERSNYRVVLSASRIDSSKRD